MLDTLPLPAKSLPSSVPLPSENTYQIPGYTRFFNNRVSDFQYPYLDNLTGYSYYLGIAYRTSLPYKYLPNQYPYPYPISGYY